jgi:hypothetical protein
MTKPVEFDYEVPPLFPGVEVQLHGVYKRLTDFDIKMTETLPDAADDLLEIWRARLTSLREARWRPLLSKKLMYAMNCPPCALKCKPAQQPCCLPICPHCFGRKLERMLKKLMPLIKKHRGPTVVLRRTRGHRRGSYIPLLMDPDGGMGHGVDEVMRNHAAEDIVDRRQYMKDAIGGYHWYMLAPMGYYGELRERRVGHWHVVVGAVAIMPRGWSGNVDGIVVQNVTPSGLARLLGWAMAYPVNWMHCSADVMVEYLHAVKHRQLIVPFGRVKRAEPPAKTKRRRRRARARFYG